MERVHMMQLNQTQENGLAVSYPMYLPQILVSLTEGKKDFATSN